MKKNPGVILQAAEGQKPPVVGFFIFLSWLDDRTSLEIERL
jgi:hypothetical protein